MDPSEEKSSGAGAAADRAKPNYEGPKPGVTYPLKMIYCGECTLPLDLCEYSPNPEACKEWFNKNHINLKLDNLQINESGEQASGDGASGGADGEKSKSSHQKRGGKAIPKSKKEKQPSRVTLTKNQRKGNKYVTIITGLEGNDVDLEVAKKFFASKFCCGCSKGENDELTIQGDFVDQLLNVIPEKFPQITEDMIDVKEK